MGRLGYATLASLDGYIADATGAFDWCMPDDEVHAAVNDQQRQVGTHLYGRRLYEVMAAWESMGGPGDPPVERDFAECWRAADKVVFSRTLTGVTTARTRLVREWDAGVVAAQVAAADHDVLVGGAELAARALADGLVHDVHLYLFPVVVGGGTPALPRERRLDLELVATRRFDSGVVYLHHRVRAGS